jgi:hypothetical protein
MATLAAGRVQAIDGAPPHRRQTGSGVVGAVPLVLVGGSAPPGSAAFGWRFARLLQRDVRGPPNMTKSRFAVEPGDDVDSRR